MTSDIQSFLSAFPMILLFCFHGKSIYLTLSMLKERESKLPWRGGGGGEVNSYILGYGVCIFRVLFRVNVEVVCLIIVYILLIFGQFASVIIHFKAYTKGI